MKDMTSLGVLNSDLLYNCKSVDAVRKALDELNVPKDPVKRKNFLNQFMGVTRTFGCGKSTPDEDYYVACQELVFINDQRESENL